MKTAVLAALAALAACVAVASGEKVTVETVSPHSDDWELIGPADPTLPITLTVRAFFFVFVWMVLVRVECPCVVLCVVCVSDCCRLVFV